MIYDGFANLVVSPLLQAVPPAVKVLGYPVYNAGLRFFDLRRYGRDHRKILVVDDEIGVRRRLQHRHRRTPRSGATPTCGSPAPASGT